MSAPPDLFSEKTPNGYNKQFKAAMEQLNEAQQDAVKTIEGPVLVIAGPGTGKTQILAARIGHILETTDARPEEILCLTYTDAGTIAMRKRLSQFIGPAAFRVTINTFHAFCNNVIKDNLDAFGIRALDSITELEQVELLQKLVDGIDKDSVLKRWTGDVYFETGPMKNLFQVMKREDWSPEFIAGKVEEYIDLLPEREEYQYKRANKKKGIEAGDPNQRKIDQEVRKMERLKAAAMEFPNYERLMQEQSRYDYDDMILLVLNKFKEDPDLLLSYQERYQYFLVDEYQDTNGAQNEILQQLISYWEVPNVFVVGDDDQSIYRFQGANVENILAFHERYQQHIRVVVLEENYRSSQNILDAAKTLIQRNQSRLTNQVEGITKNLEASNDKVAASKVQPQVWPYYNQLHETAGIANEILKLWEKGHDLSEVAVIYRNHRQSEDLARFLESQGVPVNIKKKYNVLESTFVQNIVDILHYLQGENKHPHSQEELLWHILHMPFFQLDPLVLARLAVDARPKKGQPRPLWRELIKSVANKGNSSLFGEHASDTFKKLGEVSDLLEDWIAEYHNSTLQVLLEKIITRGGILQYVMHSPYKFDLMQELTTFFEFVKDESVKDPKITLNGFLQVLDNMSRHKIPLEINRITFSEQGVNFLTAHGSKGLEFHTVFLMGANAKVWDKTNKGGGGSYSFPDNLVTKLEEEEDEESRRLFYVALTRAKERLVVSYANASREMKELEKSRFVAEIEESASCETLPVISLSDEDMLQYNLMLMQEERPPELMKVEEQWLRRALEKYELSVTHLNTYLRCPVSFYFQYLLKIPTAKNQYMAFGSAVHFALEKLFLEMQKSDDDRFPSSDRLLNHFEWYMFRHQDSFTDDQFERRLEYGRKILPEYYNKYVSDWNKVVSVEKNFRGIEVDGVPINGKLDKLEFEGKSVNVVDYKTGDYEKNRRRKKFHPPAEEYKNEEEPTFEEQYGGDYWRQAVFYKILVDNDHSRDWTAISSEFDFVEPDRKEGTFHKEKVLINDTDIAAVRQQIAEAYQGIMNLEFDKGCNDEYCQWCNFVKNRYKQPAEAVEEDAEMTG